MGLDITARIRKNTDIKLENEYAKKYYRKVRSGKMSMDDYISNYPVTEYRPIDVTEFGIRGFWTFMAFCHNTWETDGDVFDMNKEQIERTLKAAQNREIDVGDVYCYERKCDELAQVCERALKECDFETESVTFTFSY